MIQSSRTLLVDQEDFQIFQYRPAIRTISVYGKRVTLPFPYVLFGTEFYSHRTYKNYTNLYCGFSNKPIESDNDPVFFPALGNIYSNFNVCLNDDGGEDEDFDSENEIINHFWFSRFGTDGRTGHEILKHFGLLYQRDSIEDEYKKDYEYWQLGFEYWRSVADPTQISWPLQITFGQFKAVSKTEYSVGSQINTALSRLPHIQANANR